MTELEIIVLQIAHGEMEKWGLIKEGWKLELDNSIRRAGCCMYQRKVISLSRHMINRNAAKRMAQVVDTIRHEIAHAIAGPDKFYDRYGRLRNRHHGDKWKGAAVLVGANPKRCYDSTELDMPSRYEVAVERRQRAAARAANGPTRQRREEKNVVAHCCGNEYRRTRMPRKNARSYRICNYCRSKLEWYRED